MKHIRRPKESTYRNKNRVSTVIGTGIAILLAFSCVVGADSFLTDPSARTEGENYDMVTPDYYSYSENQTTVTGSLAESGNTADPSVTGETTEETTAPETTVPETTTTAPAESSDVVDPDASVPSEPTSTPSPTPTRTPTPTATPTPTPSPTPTPTPVITEEPWEAIFYTIGEVNVRSGPGTEYEIVKTLKPGDAIETVGITSNGWYHTVRDTYVAVSMCTSEPPSTPTPKPQASPTPKPTPKPEKNSDPTPTPKPTPKPEPKETYDAPSKDGMTLVGTDFKITFYGPDYAGPGTDNRTTATGTTCCEGRTVAVDPSVIPTGTKIYIENDPLGGDGYYIAEDTGWGVDGHHIDIFAEDGESMNTLRGYTVYIVN
ncbi:MAG: SH3 domain-containing protein [Clostridiales bacterium]|nr:SH3 domain-containing protein [Clostridiales bacterium]